ncbi:MAG: hypothetical protein FWF09_01315 [Bacteroidales bacterium]|nr:hypothetical protein [Bacteroidales bacterium]
MLENRLDLRKVVAIAICLAGFIAFSGCSKDENNSKGKIEYDGKSYELADGICRFSATTVGEMKEYLPYTLTIMLRDAYLLNHFSFTILSTETSPRAMTYELKSLTPDGDDLLNWWKNIILVPNLVLGLNVYSGLPTVSLTISVDGDTYEIKSNNIVTSDGKPVSIYYKGKLQISELSIGL